MTAPKILDWHERFGFGNIRPTHKIKNVFIHTTENAPATPAENVANYQISSESGSYHYLADRTKLLRENTDDWRTWSTGNVGNDIGLHLSFVARANMTRQQWINEEVNHGTLSRAAWQVARWCKLYGIPVKFIDGNGLRRGEKGISTHNASRVWGGTDHTDPGNGFPMDYFLELVGKELKKGNGATPPTVIKPAPPAPQPPSLLRQAVKDLEEIVGRLRGLIK